MCVCVPQVDDGGVPRRRPPARLESLKEMREQRSPSRETIDHKMAQAEERRKVGPVCVCVYLDTFVYRPVVMASPKCRRH